MPREHVEEHLSNIGNDAYIALFSGDEIKRHIHESKSDATVSTVFAHQ